MTNTEAMPVLPPRWSDAVLMRMERKAKDIEARIANDQSYLAQLREAILYNHFLREEKQYEAKRT